MCIRDSSCAYLADRNPGKLFKAGITKPESSPRDTMPEALFATRAFWRLFSKNVSPSSSSGVMFSELCEIILKLGSSRANSFNLPGLLVATTMVGLSANEINCLSSK